MMSLSLYLRKSWFLLVLVLLIAFSVDCLTFFGMIKPNNDVILSLSSVILQAYATLIAIPFTIAVIHLQSKYGFEIIGILSRKLKQIFIVFGIMFLALMASMILSTNVSLFTYLLMIETIVGLFPIPYFVKFIQDIIYFSPLEAFKALGFPDKPMALLKLERFSDTNTIYYQAFKLIRACVSDPILFEQLTPILSDINKSLIEIYCKSNFLEEKSNKKDEINKLISNLANWFSIYIVEPFLASTIKPRYLMLSSLITNMTKAFIKSDMISSFHFEKFIYDVRKLALSYGDTRDFEAAFYIFFQSIINTLVNEMEKIKDEGRKRQIIDYGLPWSICQGLFITKTLCEISRDALFVEQLKIEIWLFRILDILRFNPDLLLHLLCLRELEYVMEISYSGGLVFQELPLVIALAKLKHQIPMLEEYKQKQANHCINYFSKRFKKILYEKKLNIQIKGKKIQLINEKGKIVASTGLNDKERESIKEYLAWLKIYNP